MHKLLHGGLFVVWCAPDELGCTQVVHGSLSLSREGGLALCSIRPVFFEGAHGVVAVHLVFALYYCIFDEFYVFGSLQKSVDPVIAMYYIVKFDTSINISFLFEPIFHNTISIYLE